MQPPSAEDSAAQFKGDVNSVSELLVNYFWVENSIYLEYIQKLQYKAFDIYEYMNWRATENKVNLHRFYLPLVDAVIGDMYVWQNLNASQTQVFNLDLDKYIVFKDSVRESLTMLDPYLIFCSMYQTPPSYLGYQQWLTYQQQRVGQIKSFKEQLIPDSSVTFRQEVLQAFVADQNNPLTVQEYQKFYEDFVSNEKVQAKRYADLVQQVRNSIQNVNMFVFNDLLVAYQKEGGQISKATYEQYYSEVLKKFDLDYLNTMNEEFLEAEKTELSKRNKNQPKDKKTGTFNQQEQELANAIQSLETDQIFGEQRQDEKQGQDTVYQDQALLKSAQKCQCCKGNVYGCEGEVCNLLGNCVCLSE